MKNSLVTKSLSITLSATLLATSFSGIAGAGMAPAAAAMPDFVRTLTPPETLGFVDSYFQGNTPKPVVLIEDLHANYGVQKKIIGLLQRLQSQATPKGKAMALGMEGAWGNVDVSMLSKQTPKVKNAVADFLLKEAEISAPDSFAATSALPVHLVGIDSPEDYILHRDLFRNSVRARLQLAYKVGLLQKTIADSKGNASRGIRSIWKIEKDFRDGTLDLNGLAAKLGVPSISSYGQAEAILYQKKMDLANQAGDKALYFQNLIKADQHLQLLSRLFRQQLTMEEVQFVSKHLSEILVIVQALMPREDIRVWRNTINAAIDYYAVALMRDKPLSEHAYDLVQKNSDTSVVIVTGGFHTAGISNYLKQKGVSYIVIAPVVESNTTADEVLYLRRMLGDHVTQQEINQNLPKLAKPSTLKGLPALFGANMPKGVPVAEAAGDAAVIDAAINRELGKKNPEGNHFPGVVPAAILEAFRGYAPNTYHFYGKDFVGRAPVYADPVQQAIANDIVAALGAREDMTAESLANHFTITLANIELLGTTPKADNGIPGTVLHPSLYVETNNKLKADTTDNIARVHVMIDELPHFVLGKTDQEATAGSFAASLKFAGNLPTFLKHLDILGAHEYKQAAASQEQNLPANVQSVTPEHPAALAVSAQVLEALPVQQTLATVKTSAHEGFYKPRAAADAPHIGDVVSGYLNLLIPKGAQEQPWKARLREANATLLSA